jgi:pyruvate/2-oxoglutarate dehydrogenase complex dihydrolipoamide acyltransferase (E2) component
MPALELAQDTGKLIAWLKKEGEQVTKGEPLMEIETDKVTVEIESPASGFLAGVSAAPGEAVPVGKVIAWILAAGETAPPAIANRCIIEEASEVARTRTEAGVFNLRSTQPVTAV